MEHFFYADVYQENNRYQAIELIEKIVLKKLDYVKFYTITVGSGILSSFIIPRGSGMLTAASKVHSDFVEKFICAEVSMVYDWKNADDENEMKLKGTIKKVGKDFIVDKSDYVIKFVV